MTSWQVAHAHGTTDVHVGDQFRTDSAPDELWEVSGPPVEMIESDYGDGACPSFPCTQIAGDTTRYAASREPDGTITMCGDAVAEAIWSASS